MSGLYQILINGEHRQTCFALTDKDALEIALRWFNDQPIEHIQIKEQENASHTG